MPHLHFMMDAYDIVEEHTNNPMAVYEILNNTAVELGLEPVMPPFLVPYYYCDDAEDGGISAFVICRGGHVTIHTFPYRSCYFVDIMSDNFFTQREAEQIFRDYFHANQVRSEIVDRRCIYNSPSEEVDVDKDFGPHYMIEVKNIDMSFDWIYKWLDNIAENINMLPITRPYVITDKKENPEFISGILVVAQSHIAVHYNIAERSALIDIFSCAFLDGQTIKDILERDFGEHLRWKLYSRGSKHDYQYKQKSERVATNKSWRSNIQ